MSSRDVELITFTVLHIATAAMIYFSIIDTFPNVVTCAFVTACAVAWIWMITLSLRAEIIKHIDQVFAAHLAQEHDQEDPEPRPGTGEENLAWLKRNDHPFGK